MFVTSMGGKRMRIIFVLGCMLLCSSCGVSLRASLYGAKDIPIYKVAPEHRRYSEVSLVAGEDTELSSAFDELRLAARKIKADAVLLDTTLSIFTDYKKKLVGMAIRF